MSLWSILGKVGKGLVKGVANEFTGGLVGGGKSQAPGILGAAGGAIGAATSASGQNRLNQQNLTMQANRDNIAGNASYENSLGKRAEQEAAERKRARMDIMRASAVKNPNVSQFNTQGPRKYSPEMLAAMTELEKRGLQRLQMEDQYTTDKMPKLAGYTPLATNAKQLQKQTGTEKGLMETIGDFAAPGLSIVDAVRRAQMRPYEDGEFVPQFPGDVEF
jgi:hypothetical protein